MLVAEANVTATVRAAILTDCALALVVTPVATVTVHSDAADSVAVAAVSVSVAPAAPELDPAAVNVVLPHPDDVLISEGDATIVNVGSTRAMVSAASKGPFNSNRYDTDVAEEVCGVVIVRLLVASAGANVCVEVAIASALMSDTAANVTATVRPARFAA